MLLWLWYRYIRRRPWFLDGSGEGRLIVSIGHCDITVYGKQTPYLYSTLDPAWRFRRYQVHTLAEIAGWSEERMRTWLGLPDQAALKEAGMTLGEWLHDNRGR